MYITYKHIINVCICEVKDILHHTTYIYIHIASGGIYSFTLLQSPFPMSDSILQVIISFSNSGGRLFRNMTHIRTPLSGTTTLPAYNTAVPVAVAVLPPSMKHKPVAQPVSLNNPQTRDPQGCDKYFHGWVNQNQMAPLSPMCSCLLSWPWGKEFLASVSSTIYIYTSLADIFSCT